MSAERKKRKAPTHRVAPVIAAVFALAAAIILLVVPPWVLPPIQSIETGPAAIEMVQFKDGDRDLGYTVPAALPAAEPYEGEQTAGEVYENVEVLSDLSEGEFTRLMLAITEWVSPEQGCEYCHNLEEGFASDAVYTKVVARQMLEMTRNINSNWPEHVAPAGVTCYTCHRGENVPSQSWYDQEEPDGSQFLGKPRPWYLEAKTIRQFFPAVPYMKYLADDPETARIQSMDPLASTSPTGNGEGPTPVAEAPNVDRDMMVENLYLAMMQQSNALGVNCTYCHNSRAFADWSQSTPFRWIGYWGIRMARDINVNYIEPLTDVFPPERLGPLGDPAKVHCGTCHRGETQPLAGNQLMHAYTAGLSLDGTVPDPAPKEAVLLGTAIPAAQTGSDEASPAAEPAPVNETAIEQSVAPGGENADGSVQYQSQEEPGQPVDDPAIEAATEALPPETPDEASPPGDIPTGANAPSGASPEQLRPGTTAVDGSGTNDAPSSGDPGTGQSSFPEEPGSSQTSGDVDPTADRPVNEGSTSMNPGEQPEIQPGGEGQSLDPGATPTESVGDAGGAEQGASAGGQQASEAETGSRPAVTIVPRSSN